MDSSSKAMSCRFQQEYIRTIPGILKCVQLTLSIIAFGLATAVADEKCDTGKYKRGFGWVSFVAIFGFVQALVCLSLHTLMTTNWTWPRLLEMGFYALLTICFTISGIVAAALHSPHCSYHLIRVAGAAAAFSFFCMVVWAVDFVLQAMNVRVTVTNTRTTTTTTTTTANTDVPQRFEGSPQY